MAKGDTEREILYWFNLHRGEWLSYRRLCDDMLLRWSGVGGVLARMVRNGVLIEGNIPTGSVLPDGVTRWTERAYLHLETEEQQAEQRRRLAIIEIAKLVKLMAHNRDASLSNELAPPYHNAHLDVDPTWGPFLKHSVFHAKGRDGRYQAFGIARLIHRVNRTIH